MESGGNPVDPPFPTVPTLIEQAAQLSEAAFAARYPGPFLLIEAIHPDEDAWRSVRTSTAIPAVRKDQARTTMVVMPVTKRDNTNPYTWMITIGRTRTNDVVLPDVSISKLHGWIRRRSDAEGVDWYHVTDAGSRNGTFVNGAALRSETGALPLGAHLRLGDVETLFLDGVLLHRALRLPASAIFSAA